jgi:hypothetical protein
MCTLIEISITGKYGKGEVMKRNVVLTTIIMPIRVPEKCVPVVSVYSESCNQYLSIEVIEQACSEEHRLGSPGRTDEAMFAYWRMYLRSCCKFFAR